MGTRAMGHSRIRPQLWLWIVISASAFTATPKEKEKEKEKERCQPGVEHGTYGSQCQYANHYATTQQHSVYTTGQYHHQNVHINIETDQQLLQQPRSTNLTYLLQIRPAN